MADTPTHFISDGNRVAPTTQVTFCSLNMRGLNIPEKRFKLLYMLQKSKIQIAFIQETHFRSDSVPKLFNHYFPTVYLASTDSYKTKGVAILISKNCPIKISDIKKDSNGRFLFLKGTLHNRSITLANICPQQTTGFIFS